MLDCTFGKKVKIAFSEEKRGTQMRAAETREEYFCRC